jgi:hypothetical protein
MDAGLVQKAHVPNWPKIQAVPQPGLKGYVSPEVAAPFSPSPKCRCLSQRLCSAHSRF